MIKRPPLEMIKVSCSPLSNRIQLYRMGRRSSDTALESRDVTNEALIATIDHLMHTPLKQGVFTATIAGGKRVKYTLSVVEEELTDAKEEQNSVGQAAGGTEAEAGGGAEEDRPASLPPTGYRA